MVSCEPSFQSSEMTSALPGVDAGTVVNSVSPRHERVAGANAPDGRHTRESSRRCSAAAIGIGE